MLTNRLKEQAKIESIVFLDIDQTSILFNDYAREHVYNQLLFNKLAKQNEYDLVLFSNMSTFDINYLNDASCSSCITREQLIDELQQEGFRVHGVITPADPDYDYGPGAAYQDIYKMAYIKAQRKESNQYECDDFIDHFKNIPVSKWVQQNYTRKGAQKYAMYSYFLKNMPDYLKNLKHIHYYDDDKNCLEAVYLANYHASSSIKIVPYLVNGMKTINKLEKVTPKISKLAMIASDRIKPYSDVALVVGGAGLLSFGLFAVKSFSAAIVDSLESSLNQTMLG